MIPERSSTRSGITASVRGRRAGSPPCFVCATVGTTSSNAIVPLPGSEDFELAAPAPLNLVCFRHRAGDDFNRELMDRLNAGGKLYLTHTVLNGRFTLRLCVGQTRTEERHVEAAWRAIQEAAEAMALRK